MSENELRIFQDGDLVNILQGNEIIDTGRIINDKRSEIEIESFELHPGTKTTFAYFPSDLGYKMLFEGMGGERCFSQRAPVYNIQPKT